MLLIEKDKVTRLFLRVVRSLVCNRPAFNPRRPNSTAICAFARCAVAPDRRLAAELIAFANLSEFHALKDLIAVDEVMPKCAGDVQADQVINGIANQLVDVLQGIRQSRILADYMR